MQLSSLSHPVARRRIAMVTVVRDPRNPRLDYRLRESEASRLFFAGLLTLDLETGRYVESAR